MSSTHKSYTPHHANLAALAGLSLIVLSFVFIGHQTLTPSHAETAVTPVGQTGSWNMQFNDEFNASQLDSTKWTVGEPWNSAPGFEEGPESYCPLPINLAANDLVTENSGSLNLNAKLQATSGHPVQSCFITSRGKFQNFTHGYVEARVKLPAGADLWPAFWLLGNGSGDQGWPKTGEIDIFEFVNNGNENGIPFFTTHWYNAACNGGHCQKTQDSPYPAKVANYTSQWVTFGLKRTASELTVYINGVKAYGFTTATLNADNQKLSSVLFNDPMHIRFDLSAGGWADNTSLAPVAGTMQVDYVRAWQEGSATSTPPTTPTTPAAVTGDVNGDGHVNTLDLSLLLSHDGQNYPAADFNKDGTIGAADLAVLLSHWTW